MSRSQEKVAITREKGVPGGEAIAPGVVAPGLVLAGSSPRPPDLQLRTWRPGRAKRLPGARLARGE